MNQNGFEPRNTPGYSYGQPNSYPQGGYPAAGAPQQGGMQNPAAGYPQNAAAFQPPQGGNLFAQNTPAFGYPPVQGGSGYTPAAPTPAAGGYAPTPQMTTTGGYTPTPQMATTGGYNPVNQSGYTPTPPASVTGGYAPAPGAPVTGGYSPVPPAASVNTGYSPVPPAAAGTGYNTYAQQQAQPAGSFIPRTPYSPGYTSPGYQPSYPKPAANGYPQGYSAYNQMGRAPQTTAPQQPPAQVPLNGGGYKPQQANVRRRPMDRNDILLLGISGVLILLFILALVVDGGTSLIMKLLFLIPAAGTIALLWLKPITADNKRFCFTVVAGAMCIIMAINVFTNGKQPTDRTNRNTTTASQSTGTDTSGNGNTGKDSTTTINNNVANYGDSNIQQNTTSTTPTPEPETNISALNRAVEFFGYWSQNELDNMVALCSPSWQVKQENPKKALFQVLQNRVPIGEITLRNDPGQVGDSLNFLFDVTVSRNNGKPAEDFRMNVRMVQESGEWYVDPNSLISNEVQETPDPNATPVVTPTPTPHTDGNTTLYYNPDGGKLYHRDANCISIHSKYLPLKGSFTYSQINDAQYASLEPCNVCGAPLRGN
ncbi:MAG: hypothetical protein IJK06_03065 [Clostridia bacterium]|nr:hypothetical protein [Clostridia bacterium]